MRHFIPLAFVVTALGCSTVTTPFDSGTNDIPGATDVLPVGDSAGECSGSASCVDVPLGVGTDAGRSPPNVQTINNCTPSMYVDHSAASADHTVSFGGMNNSPPFGFSPACLTITVGQSVTFNGIFAAHPLAPGTSPGPAGMTAGSPGNPIVNTTGGSTVTFAFPTAGLYPYYCQMHYASGMVGVVLVQ